MMASGTFKYLQVLPITVIVVLLSLFIHHLVVISTLPLFNEPPSHAENCHPNHFEIVTSGYLTFSMNSHKCEYVSIHTNGLEPTSSNYSLLKLNDDTYHAALLECYKIWFPHRQ